MKIEIENSAEELGAKLVDWADGTKGRAVRLGYRNVVGAELKKLA